MDVELLARLLKKHLNWALPRHEAFWRKKAIEISEEYEKAMNGEETE